MARSPDRRQFLKRLLALSAAGTAFGVAGCTSQPDRPVALAPTASATPPPSATPQASEVPSPLPSPTTTATAVPTAAPTARPTAIPSATLTATAVPTATPSPTPVPPAMAVVRGGQPADAVRRAIAALGGIEKFVKQGADVIVKPNICNSYHGPEYASTTNPEVVATIVALCLGAGARRVRVMDLPFAGVAPDAYVTSGIAEAVKAAGGEMELMNPLKYRELALPNGRNIKKWQVYGEVLDADVLINVPIAKDHGAARLTLGMKNLMGVVRDRNGLHARGLHQCIADLNTGLRPQLTIVDAVRILMANGPTGGRLQDVKETKTIIASADPVAADAYATALFDMTAEDIGYIRLGAEMGLGQADLKAVPTEEIAL